MAKKNMQQRPYVVQKCQKYLIFLQKGFTDFWHKGSKCLVRCLKMNSFNKISYASDFLLAGGQFNY